MMLLKENCMKQFVLLFSSKATQKDFACSDESMWKQGTVGFKDFLPARTSIVQVTFLIYGRYDCRGTGQNSLDLLFNENLVVCCYSYFDFNLLLNAICLLLIIIS